MRGRERGPSLQQTGTGTLSKAVVTGRATALGREHHLTQPCWFHPFIQTCARCCSMHGTPAVTNLHCGGRKNNEVKETRKSSARRKLEISLLVDTLITYVENHNESTKNYWNIRAWQGFRIQDQYTKINVHYILVNIHNEENNSIHNSIKKNRQDYI